MENSSPNVYSTKSLEEAVCFPDKAARHQIHKDSANFGYPSLLNYYSYFSIFIRFAFREFSIPRIIAILFISLEISLFSEMTYKSKHQKSIKNIKTLNGKRKLTGYNVAS